MTSFKDLSNLRLARQGMSMQTCPWLLDFLAKPTVIRSSPLTPWRKRGRRWFMGVAFPLVQSFHGKVLHECIQGTCLSFLLLPALPPLFLSFFSTRPLASLTLLFVCLYLFLSLSFCPFFSFDVTSGVFLSVSLSHVRVT